MAALTSLRWGILGTGSIAKRFAKGLPKSKTGYLSAVGSRTIESARSFSGDHGGTAYGSYDEVLRDDNVHAVYIALPHHMHAEWTMKCADAGKHILCEKPFTLNSRDSEKAIDRVLDRDVFFMEAFMYRCHPQTVELKRLVDSGTIGEIQVINAEFGFNASKSWDNFRAVASVGGGGLMDVGTYCVSMSRLIAGEEPSRIEYTAHLVNGYDGHGTGILGFPNGVTAMIGCGIHSSLKNVVTIYGSTGRIEVPAPWMCDQPFLIYRNGTVESEYVRKGDGEDLYGNEADVVAEFVEDRECPYMTWKDTLGNQRTLDRMRESAGFRFDGDAW